MLRICSCWIPGYVAGYLVTAYLGIVARELQAVVPKEEVTQACWAKRYLVLDLPQ
jgi:hypothetical protein